MKRLLLFMVIAALCLLPVQAQDSCAIDLLDEISSLAEAQSLAASGDTAAAAELILSVRDQLSDQLDLCAQSSVLLPATFEFPDGMFRFKHPDGWAQLSPIAGVSVLGSSQDAVNITVQSNFTDAIPAGSQVIVAAYGDAKDLFNSDSFADFLADMNDESFSGIDFVSPEDVTIKGYKGVKQTIVSDQLEGSSYVLDLGSDNQIAFFLGITPPDEFAAFEPTFEAIVHSIELGEGQPTGDPTPVPTIVATTNGTPLSELTYSQAAQLVDFNEDIDTRSAVLSPDGASIAWYDGGGDGSICLYAFADASSACNAIPEIFHSVPPVLLWSPDSRYIAFTQDGIIRFNEPDIWVLNTENGTFANRTDDNVNYWRIGSEVQPPDSEGPLWFDYTFTWGPDNNIYIMRYTALKTAEFGTGTSAFYRVSPSSGTAELIRDVTSDFERLSLYQMQQYDLNGAMTVSPDASQLAFTIQEREPDSEHNGVWVLPLSGDEAPHQVLQASEFASAATSESQATGDTLFAAGLAWTPDQSGLFIYAFNAQRAMDVPSSLYHFDLTTSTLTPLTDFSSYTREEIFTTPADGEHSVAFMIPRAAVMSPDSTAPMMLNFEPGGGPGALSAFIPGEDGYELTTLLEFEYAQYPGHHASVSSDGKVLLFGWLFLPE